VPGHTFANIAAIANPARSTTLTVTGATETNQNQFVNNERNTLGVQLAQAFGHAIVAKIGIDNRLYSDRAHDVLIRSRLLSTTVNWSPTGPLRMSVTREQNLQAADPTYPTQTVLGGQFAIAPGTTLFASHRRSEAPIRPIDVSSMLGGASSLLSTRDTAIGITSQINRYFSASSRYQIDNAINGSDGFALIGVQTRAPIGRKVALDFNIDSGNALTRAGQRYIGGGIAMSYLLGTSLRATARYETRHLDTSQHSISLNAIGRASRSLSILGNYTVLDGIPATSKRVAAGRLALALRPPESDRAAILFTYQADNSGSLLASVNAGQNRKDSVSSDVYLRVNKRVESSSRVMLFREMLPDSHISVGSFLQTRIQRRLWRWMDLALEARRVQVFSEPAAHIYAGEAGGWVGAGLRVGVGYSSDGFHNPGSLIRATASRGGPYLVFTSTLSSLFDFMGRDD
jgi:hypothetical protein